MREKREYFKCPCGPDLEGLCSDLLGCSQDNPGDITAVRETLPGTEREGIGVSLPQPLPQTLSQICPRPTMELQTYPSPAMEPQLPQCLIPLWFDSTEVTGLDPVLLKCGNLSQMWPGFSSLSIICGPHFAEMLQVKNAVEVFFLAIYFSIGILLLQIPMQICNLGF